MNVVGHEYIPPNADAKVSCPPAIFDEGFVYLGFREQARSSVSIKCYKVDRRIEALEEQIQSWGLVFEHALHGKSCSA